jgi:5'-nucleotidase/UDP-sugar diphosphatase
MKKVFLTLLLSVWLLAFAPPSQNQTITMLHISDYHSHALPFYSEGESETAGLARLMAYLKPYAAADNTLIFSGGDTVNIGASSWSDKYQCIEWPWFNGIIDAMAFGNHDADYGPAAFEQCRAQIDYPILSSNILDANGQPFFQYDGKTYKVFEVDGLKLGVFAVAGPDFDALVKPAQRPAEGVTFGNNIETAREVVRALREDEGVNAVIAIGHSLYEDDIAMAQAVPGIDIIFGTHSHRKEALTQLPGTNTWFISPFQYGTYVSNIQVSFSNGAISGVSGDLVRMSNTLPQDPEMAARINQLQAELEADPQYAPLFEVLGSSAVDLSTEGQFFGESVFGNYVMDIFRDAAKANMAVSTASSFRASIAPGTITEEVFRTAIPYKNAVLNFSLTGEQIQELLDFSISRSGSDFFSQVSGVRFNISDGKAVNIRILSDANNAEGAYEPLDPAKTYTVATSDYQGKIATGYKDIFAKGTATDTGIADIRDNIREHIRNNSPVSAQLDGRITFGAPAEEPAAETPAPVPAELPRTGGENNLAVILLAGCAIIAMGIGIRRRA